MNSLLVRKKNVLRIFAVLLLNAVFTGCSGPVQTTAEVKLPATDTAAPPTPTVAVPPATPSPSPTWPAVSSSRVEVLFFDSSNYPKDIITRVYLPPGYDPDREVPYPVLVMLHGLTQKGSQWEDLGLLDAADDLIAAGEIDPMVIILPEEYFSTKGYSETTFAEVLVDELLPYLYSQYNLCQERECTAIGGLSRGAGWAARLVFTRWEVFGVAGLHSMPLPFLPLAEWIRAIPPGSMPKLYMDIGTEDVEYWNARDFDALLNLLEIPHEWVVQPGVHAAEYWSAHVRDYLLWYGKVLSQ